MIATNGFDPQYGARPIKRAIQRQIFNELSKLILANKIDKDQTILLDTENDAVVFRNN